jgi:Family of unknown function (DUF6428)
MNVQQFIDMLQANDVALLRLRLPNGGFIPYHFHVTEVGRIDKNFIDCGGTQRKTSACLLQTWTAHDLEHRLTAGKLAKIMQLALPILETTDLPVEIEYGEDVAAQYQLTEIQVIGNALDFTLAVKRTDCLAKDKCGIGDGSNSGCCG